MLLIRARLVLIGAHGVLVLSIEGFIGLCSVLIMLKSAVLLMLKRVCGLGSAALKPIYRVREV